MKANPYRYWFMNWLMMFCISRKKYPKKKRSYNVSLLSNTRLKWRPILSPITLNWYRIIFATFPPKWPKNLKEIEDLTKTFDQTWAASQAAKFDKLEKTLLGILPLVCICCGGEKEPSDDVIVHIVIFFIKYFLE